MFRTTTESGFLNLDLTGYEVHPEIEVTQSGAPGHGGMMVGHTRAMLRLPLSTGGTLNAGIITEPGVLGSIRIDLSIPALRALHAALAEALAERDAEHEGGGGALCLNPDCGQPRGHLGVCD